ncbi:hypothetical protein AM587_10002009 [Phytophthora nicotianae]|uniref:Uncharacterized protein n=1 Tax=Phytophthora nicotianae TaxID=4792 RepID=A0A0W8CKS7_PHYNI|nr:hypothetical protein AM587_10002009 [Phytophthora nicotianae]
MSISAFVPTNTQKARATAISAFKQMLELEGVSMEFVHASILKDDSGKRLAAAMDRFGYYLATNEDDLKALVRYVYSTARVGADYQDAALACLMWHCFGRSSDLGYVQKQHGSVSADGAFYLRLLRVKTAKEQGLTLVPYKVDFLSCPLLALSVTLATQEAPCASLLGHLPALNPQAATLLDAGAPLHDLLAVEPASLQGAVVPTTAPAATIDSTVDATASPTPTSPSATTYTTVSSTPSHKKPSGGDVKRGEDSMQGHVNRMLKRVAEPAGLAADLTSHSFRRGGAQHANGDDHLAAQWIFDRGAWDMTKTSKAFAYITNTAREDRKVARVLSGWDADASPTVIDIAEQDHTTRERLGCLQELLFSTCTGLKDQRLNVSTKALSVLTAYLVRYFPQLKALAPEAPIVTRVEECLAAAQISVIDELIALNKVMAARLAIVEAAQLKTKRAHVTTEQEQVQASSDQARKPKRRKKQATNLSATWYEWYTRVPRVWDSSDRQKKSEFRHVVAFMKLFLTQGFALDAKAEDYKDQVLDAGRRAEDAVLAFLKARGTNAKGAGSVLRVLRPLHKSGALDERIAAYKRLLAIGRIEDPAPVDTQDILAIAGHV